MKKNMMKMHKSLLTPSSKPIICLVKAEEDEEEDYEDAYSLLTPSFKPII